MASVYVYQSALYCEPCGEAVEHDVFAAGVFESADSDDAPQGPYADGGGEADSPQHCDACGAFLDNPLTGDGVAYVADLLGQHKANGRGSKAVLAEWVAAYASTYPAIAVAAAETAAFLDG